MWISTLYRISYILSGLGSVGRLLHYMRSDPRQAGSSGSWKRHVNVLMWADSRGQRGLFFDSHLLRSVMFKAYVKRQKKSKSSTLGQFMLKTFCLSLCWDLTEEKRVEEERRARRTVSDLDLDSRTLILECLCSAWVRLHACDCTVRKKGVFHFTSGASTLKWYVS